MAKILTADYNTRDSVLFKKSLSVAIPTDSSTKLIIQTLIDVFKDIGGGAGLAAPQIGFDKRIILCCYSRNLQDIEILINPEYKPIGNKSSEGWEGCFSIPNTVAKVNRWNDIKISYYNINGKEVISELNGQKARIFQHEFDHLEGVLMPDKASDIKTFEQKEDYLNFFKNFCVKT